MYYLHLFTIPLISVMPYKVYNEQQGVGTTAKTLKSVIYYNVCNVPTWRHQDGRKWHMGVILQPCQHGGTRNEKTDCKQFAARERLKHSV